MIDFGNNKYSDCQWFRDLICMSADVTERNELKLEKNNNYLVDNRTQRFLSRYFDSFYLVDVGGEYRNDICLLRHSNGVCVIGLASGHHLFDKCNIESLQKEDYHHVLKGLDFQVNDKINLLEKQVKGRRKHGGHTFNKSTDVVANVICDQNYKHPILCGIPGYLLEVNHKLVYEENESLKENATSKNNNCKIRPIGGLLSNSNFDQIDSYICIIRPKLRKNAKLSPSNNNNNNLLIVENSEYSISFESDLIDGKKTSLFEHTTLPENQKVLCWNEYFTLRTLKQT